jgi:tetratricopeptide (TPR) repeat protein
VDSVNEAPGPDAAYAEAVTHHKAARYAQAEAICKAALASHPHKAKLWNLRGVNFRAAKRYSEAIACLRQGLAIAPENAGLWSCLGNVLKDVKQCESAVACHRRALALAPDKVVFLHNLGIALSEAGLTQEALAVFDRAAELDPGNASLLWDRAHRRLRAGDYAGGWEDYETRVAAGKLPKRVLPGQPWRGERYDGKRLVVVSEQGLGDAMWVARYFSHVKALGGELVVESRQETFALLEAMGVADKIVPKRDPLPDADLHVLQMSLPRLLAADGFLAEPYITPSPEQVQRLAPVMPPGRLRIGIVWGGSPTYNARAERDASLALFLRWFALPGVQLFSFQKGPQADDLKPLPAGTPIVDLSPHTADFYETAGAVAHLDLMLTTDTAVAHLAGGMGKPVWLLLNRVPHWLWLEGRSDCPWYPTMRLFRQGCWGDWNGAFDQAAAALIELLNRRA